MLWIWKFSSRQRKQREFLNVAKRHFKDSFKMEETIPKTKRSVEPYFNNWVRHYGNADRPLVVDLGCGMGVSLLSLSKENKQAINTLSPISLNWSDCNFVGVDLSQLAIGYASGIASRWKLGKRLQFLTCSAETFLDDLNETYQGPVELIMIQFPTPFALKDHLNNDQLSKGNSQLPQNATDGFMVTRQLLNSAHKLLATSGGSLLVQSNCEDVAVFIRNLAMQEANFGSLSLPEEIQRWEDNIQHRRTKRIQR